MDIEITLQIPEGSNFKRNMNGVDCKTGEYLSVLRDDNSDKILVQNLSSLF